MFSYEEIMISVLKDVSNVKLKSKTRIISIFNIFITSFNVRSHYIFKPKISVQPYFQYFLLENTLPNILNLEKIKQTKIQFGNLAKRIDLKNKWNPHHCGKGRRHLKNLLYT